MCASFRLKPKRCFSNEAILHLDKVLVPDPSYPTYQTKTIISCNNIPLQATKQEITDRKGKPHCSHKEKIGPFKIHIIGYHEKMDRLPVRIIFFLNKNNLCFAEYRFNALSLAAADAIRTILQQKYLPDESIPKGNFYIQDPKQHRLLYYDNGITLNIRFLDPDCPEAKDPRLLSLFENNSIVMK